MAQRALPDRPAPPRRRSVRGPSAIEHNVPLMLALAIGIPLIIAILVTAVYLDRSTTAQVDTLLNEARQSIQEADTSVSAQVKRERWQIALAKIAQALALDPANQPAIETRTQVQTQIDRIDNTVRVSPALLYDFNKTGRRRLALSDIYLFVLDQTAGSVDRLTLTSDGGSIEGTGPAQVLASGTTVVDRLVSDLIDMAWVDAGGARQKSALIMLERGGLVEYDLAFGLETIPFANTTPEGAQRLDAFDGNLYVLDVGGRQVWRYAPSDDGGYSGQADPYFASSPAGIENAIDMAIDGSIYLLEASGTVHKYFAREEVAFALTGLPTPITKPVAIAVDPVRAPGESGVYIADLDGARVLHFTPEGQFVRQIRSTGGEFDAIEDIWVDEGGNRLYTVSGGRVYSAALAAAVTP
jgi:hypothetical protein